mmetsp:Transcript_34591/g.52922  ORF Transcript_34591/g.52922 Transcript_34591/m.52922 type:complete len:101 (-) Transcript_34591:31-333(-)
MVISIAGIFLFPPFLICLIMEEGDLDTCSLGIWGNAYKDSEARCETKDDWQTNQLTDAQAVCYMNRYKDLREKYGPQNDLCGVRIHWDTYGSFEGRNPNC